jgi:CheY-like chemotaxis protein
MNLVVNARDAMPPSGGSIVIETGVFELTADKQHNFPDLAPGRYVTLAVRDTGLGMTEDVRQRIFEPFFTTKALGQGTGLGLTMVYGIVSQSSGVVRVDSSPGHGSTFTIYLPAVDDAAPVETVREARDMRGTETILLVEDEAAVRASTRRMLERNGYTVLEARHGGDALALWRVERQRIALVLSDVRMPLMGGAEMVREIRRDAPDTRFLLMSGYAEVDASPFLADLSVPFIEKPFTSEALLQRVRDVLDAKPPG